MATYRQTFSASCGAAALLCAAHELGIAQMNDHSDVANFWIQAPLQLHQPAECALYQVTAGAPAVIEYGDFNGLGYSLPNRIVRAAQLLGLQAQIYRGESLVGDMLQKWYDEALQGVAVIEGAPAPLQGNQRAITPMRAGQFLGLHYLMRRPAGDPQGEYMDPGRGQDGLNYQTKDTLPSCGDMLRERGFPELMCIAAEGIRAYNGIGVDVVVTRP